MTDPCDQWDEDDDAADDGAAADWIYEQRVAWEVDAL